MSYAPLVSVVVATYDYAQYLPECLRSILGQEGGYDLEIVLADDASTDDTHKIVDSFSDSRIRYLRHTHNQGLVPTMNEGFAAARGKFIARLDADDRYRPSYLPEVLRVFDNNPDVGLVYADAAAIDEQGRIISEIWQDSGSNRVHGGKDYKGNEFFDLLTDNFIPSPTVIARREAWRDGFPLPLQLAPTLNDWYLNLRLARKHTFYYLSRPLAEYRIHSRNMTRTPCRNTSLEQSAIGILDEIFAETDQVEKKAKIRNAVYSKRYLSLADRYFGLHMDADSRRCFLKALTYQPGCVFSSGHLRRFVGTLLGHGRYEAAKSWYRTLRQESGVRGQESVKNA